MEDSNIEVLNNLIKESIKLSGIDTFNKEYDSYKVIYTYNDGGNTPGINFTKFRLIINTDTYEVTDILLSENGTYLQVVDKYWVALGIVYTLRLINNDPMKFICPSQVRIGSLFFKDMNVVEE